MIGLNKKYLLIAATFLCTAFLSGNQHAEAEEANGSVDFLANYFRLIDSYEKLDSFSRNLTFNTEGIQQLSLSYKGSTGLLSLGSGYIYTGQELSQNALTSFQKLGFREYSLSESIVDPYIGLSANSSQEIVKDVVVGIGASFFYGKDSKEILFGPDEESNIKILFLLDMPVNLGKHLTISPEFQWSKSYSPQADGYSSTDDPAKEADIYGGVSIHFAY